MKPSDNLGSRVAKGVSCSGKDGFDTHELAMDVARRMRRGKIGARIGAYRCRFCRRWHVGGHR